MPWRRPALAAVLALLCGCSATIPAPIQNDSTSLGPPGRFYRVLPGDTLYSIAFETGHDYRQLARLNHIPRPYQIEVGERIRLVPSRFHRTLSPAPSSTPRVPAVASGRPLPARRSMIGRSLAPREAPLASPPIPTGPRWRPVRSWVWPAQGTVRDTFGRGPSNGRPGNKGIDIIGHYGEPIRAAAAGRVVYVGSGLPGYGELIIIKHNNHYLSAYAHNAQVEVQEGAMVHQGQIIATMGDSGTDRVELDFEIRKRGIAVDPIRYLPHIHHE